MTKSKKIIDNPSQSELLELSDAIENLKELSSLFPELKETFDKFDEVKKQLTKLEIPDQFNAHFAKLGWIAYESMNFEIMQKAITIDETNGQFTAEEFLTNSYDETTLNQGILRFKGNNHFRKRIRLAKLAKDDYLAGRYHACIPLLLSLIDGLVNDVSKHIGFFANNIDLTAWDCIAAHESGLQTLSSLMNQSRKKTNEEIISIPYRNGILHGRELNFDNKTVAAKCWVALFAIRDWAEAIDSGKKDPQPKEDINCAQLLEKISKTELTKKSIEEWKARSSDELIHLPFEGNIANLPSNTPEHAIATFIDHWHNKRFSFMGDMLAHVINYTQGKKSGLARQDFGNYIPVSFKILDVKDTSPALSHVITELHIKTEDQTKMFQISIHTEYQNSEGDLEVRSIPNGQWKIIQNSFKDIINKN